MQTINSSEALNVTAHTVLTVWSLCREPGANLREGPCVCRARCCGLVPPRCCPRGWGIWLSEAAGLHLVQHSVVRTGGHTALRYSGVPLRTSGASQSQKRGFPPWRPPSKEDCFLLLRAEWWSLHPLPRCINSNILPWNSAYLRD